MTIHPILKLCRKPTIRLNPPRITERPEAAAWLAQCIANWSRVESAIGNLFVNLLGTNLSAGAALYNDMGSAVAKDKALASVALASLSPEEFTLLEALLKLKKSLQSTRDRLAHWHLGTCDELSDSLVLVDPRYLMEYRAGILDRRNRGDLSGAQINLDEVYGTRVKDLQAAASEFSALEELIFQFASLVAEKNPSKRERRHLALSSDARIRPILDPDSRSAPKRNRPAPP
jgi:hypothetical protein